MEATKTLLTAEDLLRLPRDGRRHELVKGELVEMTPVGPRHGLIALRLGRYLQEYAEANQLGGAMVETGFCLECRPDTVRAPDVSFVSADRLTLLDREGFVPEAPDLAVEVVSPDETDHAVQDKVMDYLTHGTRLVWVVRPRQRTVTVYRPDGSARVLRETDTLDGEDVVPGFSLSLQTLFGSGPSA